MADGDWTSIFVGLPPVIQGGVAIVVVGSAGYAAWRKFMSNLQGRGAASTDYAFGEPTTFADMTSVKKLAEQVEKLTLQMMKSSVSSDSVAAALVQSVNVDTATLAKVGQLCDLFASYLVDLREQREHEELDKARREGYEAGQRARGTTPAKPRTRRTPT